MPYRFRELHANTFQVEMHLSHVYKLRDVGVLYPIDEPHLSKRGKEYDLCRMRNKDMTKAEQMRQHIAARESSTRTVEQYCRETGLSKAVYYYWHKRLQKQDNPASFVPVDMTGAWSDGVVMHYPNGISITFQHNISTIVLKELICCI